jgi:fucose 4-O-acetylase-like acetyltransferase
MQSVSRAGEGRNASVDVFRGLLVLLVMLGHFSEISQRQNFLTWLGFGFRMPVFIGLTGYMFNLEQARSMTLPALFEKYYGRLILPWLVACAVHLTIVGAIDWSAPLNAIFRPPFHLWFVPVMMAFIFTARACRLDPTRMLAIAIPASIAAMYIFGVGYNIEQYQAWVPDHRYFTYPIYFTFGMWVARRPFDPSIRDVPLLVALIGLFWWCRLYEHPARAGEVAAELILCVPLILLLPRVRHLALNLPLIAGVGRDSLFVYLWHPLVFGLWASIGLSGLPLLAFSLISMLAAGTAIAHVPRLREVLGVRPPDPSARTGLIQMPYGPQAEQAG